ncbi:MAG: hypothetical protein Q3966_06210 [Neisseria sp.]|nr:hypothetical protein [Neisseria sp.]
MILTDKAVAAIVTEIEKANLIEEKDADAALAIYLRLWGNLPEPRERQPQQIAHWLAGCLFNVYFDTGNYPEAKQWALFGINHRTAEYSSHEYLQMGMVCYELKETESALEYFDMAYQLGKDRAFKGFDKKYLTFYLGKKNIVD